MKGLTIWVDADATPKDVKDVVFRAAKRLEISTVLVANQRLSTPINNPWVSTILVAHGPDVADSHIVEASAPGDVAITADIPLAAALVEAGVLVLDHRGEEYTEANVRERLSVRDFMDSLRGTGVETGGPSAWSPKDKRAFADALDRTLTARLRKMARKSKKKGPPGILAPKDPTHAQGAATMTGTSQHPDEALARLREGNARFTANEPSRSTPKDAASRGTLADRQDPIAIVLTCSDHRVVPEDIFDQSPGDLFVVRVAGNIAPPVAVGSIEFAAEVFGTRLVIVMGHTRCGAVGATISHLSRPSNDLSPNVREIVDRIEASAAKAGAKPGGPTSPDEAEFTPLVNAAIAENARTVASRLEESEVLAKLAETEGLRIMSAVYVMETGTVDFLTG